MTVESVTHISDLDDTYPASGDDPSEGDDHIRNIKTALSTDFANIDGAVTSTDSDLNIVSGAAAAGVTSTEFQYLNGVTSAIQTQIDSKEPTQTAASQAEMEAGTETAIRSMSPLRVAQAIAALESSTLVQVVEGTPVTSVVTTTSTVPVDSTVPQNTEGVELATATITPTSSTNRLFVQCDIPFIDSSAAANVVAALFKDSGADAVAVAVTTVSSPNYAQNMSFSYEVEAGGTSSTTYKLRAGPASGTAYFNRRSDGSTYGGVAGIRIRIMEIAS